MNEKEFEKFVKSEIKNPIWCSVSEAAKLAGVQPKTIRRAISSKKLTYKIYKERYLIDLKTLIIFMHTSLKLKNKLKNNGIGQYIKKWAE